MEIFKAGVELLQTIVNIIGGGTVIIGLIMFLQAFADNNGAQKAVGIAMAVGGGGICLVAYKLIPMLATLS